MILLLAALAMVVALSVFVYWPHGPREPVYQGRRYSEWLDRTSITNDSREQEKARSAIRAIGTNALPLLMYEFTRPTSTWRARFNEWARLHTGWQLRFEADQKRLSKAAHCLKLLGPAATPVLPELAGYFDDPDRGYYAVHVMGWYGEEAIPYIIKAAGSTNRDIWASSVDALERVAQLHEAALQPLSELLSHTDSDTQVRAAGALSALTNRLYVTLPVWTKALSHTNPNVQHRAAHVLAKLGPAARLAIPELQRVFTNTPPISGVRWSMSNALYLIDPTALLPRER